MENSFRQYEKKVIHVAIKNLYEKIAANNLDKSELEYLEISPNTKYKYILKFLREIETNNIIK